MRERILDVALELFTEQGYDQTSLRQIAEQLGVSKAALYYHFEQKEDILLALHLRLHELGRGILDQLDELEDDRARVEAWPDLLDQLIDQVHANPELFLLHQRNPSAVAKLSADERNQADHADLEQQFRAILANPAIPLTQRVRIACSVGAVFSVLMSVDGMFGDVPASEVAQLVKQAARELVS